jgi:DNA-binding beta-propeller fold protein YncE
MASHRGKVTFVAVLLIVVACTNGEASDTQPTAPPDAFASTPTIGGIPTTTLTPTTIPAERVALQRVDPVSLQPMRAFDPIPMGDYIWGSKVSPSRSYLAATVNQDSGSTELRLVDLQSWLPVTSWPETADMIIDVTESGTIHFISYGSAAEFRSIAADAAESTVVASLPSQYGIWGAEPVNDELFILYGTKPAEPGAGNTEQALAMTVDLGNEGALSEILLPEVTVGTVDPVSQGPWAQYLYNSPSFTWDPTGSRLLVAHADEDVVSEVDPLSGEVTEHSVAGTVDLGSGTRRLSAVSPDGRFLYIATHSVQLVEDDDDWLVRTSPSGVKTIDTTTWQMVVRTDEPISMIWVSPNGGMLGSGYSTEESETVYLEESTGLYLLDASDLSTRVHYPAEQSQQFWGPVTFTESGSIAYPVTWASTPQVHALELATGEILSTVEATETLEMIGPAGVLASNR